KKGNGYDVTLVETQKSTVETIVMEVPAAEKDVYLPLCLRKMSIRSSL
ncbi:hypothetical protein Tco_0330237, partial [Tanacetum coccineum]